MNISNKMSSSDTESYGDPASHFSDTSDEPDLQQARNILPKRRTNAAAERERLLKAMDEDSGPEDSPPHFEPQREPGGHLPQAVKATAEHQHHLTPMTFFKMFFTQDIVQRLCEWTNDYAKRHGPQKARLYKGWNDVTPDEMYGFFACMMYMALVQAPTLDSYWSTSPLFHGLWARHFMSKLRFKAFQAFLKACNHVTENNIADKLSKVRQLHDYIKRKCMKLYQPYQNVSVHERRVWNHGRFTFRQFVRDKPTGWDMKLWVLADPKTGYTYDFEVCPGKGVPVSNYGLAYDVVIHLCQSFEEQGYPVPFDSFYTGVRLVKDLLVNKKACLGTVQSGRTGVPAVFEDTKVFARGPRGTVRWKREGHLVFLEWLDSRPVTFLSTAHTKANKFKEVKRKTKANSQFHPFFMHHPMLVNDHFSELMGGVDESDQLLAEHMTVRKAHRWWKTLLYHFVEVARVNSYILFNDVRKKNDNIVELQRPEDYNQMDFTLDLIMEMGNITEDMEVPLCESPTPPPSPPPGHDLIPDQSDSPKSCQLCYQRFKVERNTKAMCRACNKHFCFDSERNCLLAAHQ